MALLDLVRLRFVSWLACRERPKPSRGVTRIGRSVITAAWLTLAVAGCAATPTRPELERANALIADAARLYRAGQYTEGVSKAQESLTLREQLLGPDHPDVAQSLQVLGDLYWRQGMYGMAEDYQRRALAIDEKAYGAGDRRISAPLNSLAVVLSSQERYAEAEALYRRLLEIRDRTLGRDNPDSALVLNNLARIYILQRRYAEAEPLLRRALPLREAVKDPVELARVLGNLGWVDLELGRLTDAETALDRSLALREQALGATHPDVADSLRLLGQLRLRQGRRAEAQRLLLRAVAILERPGANVPRNHPAHAFALRELATVYRSLGKIAEAEDAERQANLIDTMR